MKYIFKLPSLDVVSSMNDAVGDATLPARGISLGARPEAERLPLVYSCSGASSAAQLANHLAVRLDRSRAAEMSCIAGVGGDVEPLVRTARSGRPLVVLDGCPLRCAAQSLRRHGLAPARHYDLSRMGVRKLKHQDFDPADAERILVQISRDLSAAESQGAAVEDGMASFAGDA